MKEVLFYFFVLSEFDFKLLIIVDNEKEVVMSKKRERERKKSEIKKNQEGILFKRIYMGILNETESIY